MDGERQNIERVRDQRRPLPRINGPLLRKVLDHIRTPGVRWDQTTWRRVPDIFDWLEKGSGCGTAFCFAGWTCELSGGEWVGNSHFLVREEGDVAGSREAERAMDQLGVSARIRAGRLLGLTWYEAELLFAANNGLERVEEIVEELLRYEEV